VSVAVFLLAKKEGEIMKKVLFQLSPELLKAIDAAKKDSARNPFMERELWKVKSITAAAAALGLTQPHRPDDGRGRISIPKVPKRKPGTSRAKRKSVA